MAYDIKITGGEIVDGSGKPRYAGDIGITDGRIVALGRAPGEAAQTIDATGRVVAPGFIDLHTHYDAQVIWDPLLTISPWHGVTSVVMGNCGFGVAPTRVAHHDLIIRTLERVEGMSAESLHAGLGAEWPFVTFPEYLDAIERRGTAINVAALLGHTPVRIYVMGREAVERAATEDEIDRMRLIVRDAIEAGAIGLSTSRLPLHNGFDAKPVASRLASADEFHALAMELGRAGKGVVHLAVPDAGHFDEMARLARDSGRNVSWTALLSRPSEPGLALQQLAQSNKMLADGYTVYPQVSCRPLTIEFRFSSPFSLERYAFFQPAAIADNAGKKKIYADPEFRRVFKQEFDLAGTESQAMQGTRLGWENGLITHCPVEPALEERSIFEVAAERGVHPVDLALDLALATNLEARFRIPSVNTLEDEVEQLLRDPNPVLGLSDAGAHMSQLCDACFSTHLLGHWVREKGSLTLEHAVRILTGKPAEVYGITERGALRQGYWADVVVFDPKTVAAGKLERVNDQPAGQDRLISKAHGIDWVIVNGRVLRHGDRDVAAAGGRLPGRLLRNGATAG